MTKAAILPASLEALYSAHSTSAAKLAYALTGDKDCVEDLVQDAFVRVAARLPSVRDHASFGPYLRRTIINLARNRFRRRDMERRFMSLLGMRREEAAAPDTDSSVVVRNALQRLPFRQRAALALRYLEDLSEQEAADLLGCSTSAMNSLVARARTTLRHELEEQGYD